MKDLRGLKDFDDTGPVTMFRALGLVSWCRSYPSMHCPLPVHSPQPRTAIENSPFSCISLAGFLGS